MSWQSISCSENERLQALSAWEKHWKRPTAFFPPISLLLSLSLCVCVKAQDIFFEIPRPCCITTGHFYSLEPKVKSVTVKTVKRGKEKRTIWHWEYFDSLDSTATVDTILHHMVHPLVWCDGSVTWRATVCQREHMLLVGTPIAGQVIGWRSDNVDHLTPRLNGLA